MACKRHPYEVGAGVCASCLRERLFALIAAQNKLASSAGVPDPYPSPLNPHLPFPRSVSPYFSHRRSVGSDGPGLNRFFSTPPAGNFSRRKPHSLLSSVFGHSRSESSESRSPFSWLAALIRRKKSRKLCEAVVGSPPPLERGMSVARYREEDDGEDSGYSSDSSAVGRLPGPTPIRPPAVRRSRTSVVGRGFSGFTVCLSPLVRSNPNRRRGEVVSDQIRRHVSLEDRRSDGVNRSRKLADFGRFK